jgi:hypothetical protein
MPLPRLLETYQEARLLFTAKGWGLAKAAEHLSELPSLAGFHISHAKLSVKTKPGADNAIEPEVAAAVEAMQTWHGHERQTEIVIKGLLALHGDPSIVDVGQVAAELRERLPASELAPKLVEALERKAGQRALRLGRAFWTRIAIAGSGALVGCLALLVAPLLAGAAPPGPLMVVVFSPAGDDARRLDPRSLFDDMPARWGEKPLDQTIPTWTLPGQKVAPCNEALAEEAINGNCWIASAKVKPPCGLLFRQGDTCYRPIAAEAKKPATR